MTLRPKRNDVSRLRTMSTILLSLLLCSVAVVADDGPPPIGDMSIRNAVVHPLASFADVAVTSLAFSPDSLVLGCGIGDGRVVLVDVIDGSIIAELPQHLEAVTSVSFSPDGLWLASSGEDGWVHVTNLEVDADSFSVLHRGAVHEVEFSPQGTYLATVGDERRVRIWETKTWEELPAIEGHTGTIFALAFSPAEDLIVTGAGGDDPSIRLWDLSTGDELQHDLYEGTVHDIEYSPRARDRYASVAGTQPTIRLWEVDRGAMRHNVGSFRGAVTDVAYSSLGTTLVAVSEDGTLFFTTMPSWTERRRIEFDEPLSAVAFSPSRQYIAFGDAEGNLYLLYVPS